MSVILKGMTWSHPRGFDPMVATSKAWFEKTGVTIEWDKRSLQDFESFPVEELARAYDFIVIDHPHVGQITAEGCLEPLDVAGRETELADFANHTVGQSFPSYNWQGRQWAFPIDAAAQVQVYRPDLLTAPLQSWDEVVALAKAGKVILPLRAPHSMMSFFTLAANLGYPCATTGPGDLIAQAHGEQVVRLLAAVADVIDPDNFNYDPIEASEIMAKADSPYSVMPLGYGYVNYAISGFRETPLDFANIPAAGASGPLGSALGGTGIAVSAFCKNKPEAIDYAYWVASGPIQRTLYAEAGGQPGHSAGWEDDAVNAATNQFYRKTRDTLERAYVRPRHNGYMVFQEAASQRLNAGLLAREDASAIVRDINAAFRESF